MSDAEWAFFEPFAVGRVRGEVGGPRDHRLVLDGVFWIARTGTAWRDLHAIPEPGPGSSSVLALDAGRLWDVMLEALNEIGTGHDSVQIIDFTIIRAHQHAAVALKNGIRTRVLAALAVASRPRSISAAMLEASLSQSR